VKRVPIVERTAHGAGFTAQGTVKRLPKVERTAHGAGLTAQGAVKRLPKVERTVRGKKSIGFVESIESIEFVGLDAESENEILHNPVNSG
jgi:hypothetical protein